MLPRVELISARLLGRGLRAQLLDARLLGSRLLDARLLNGRLYIISAFNPFGLSSTYKGDNADELKAKIPSNGYGTEGKELSADKISIPDTISDCNIAVIGELDAEKALRELFGRSVKREFDFG